MCSPQSPAQFPDGEIDFLPGNAERRSERHDIAVRAVGESEDAVLQQAFDGLKRAFAAIGFHAHHQPFAADVFHRGQVGKCLERGGEMLRRGGDHGFCLRLAVTAYGLDGHRAAHRVSEERAGVKSLAVARGPGIHHLRLADADGDGETAGQRLAEANEIRENALPLASEHVPRPPEAGVDLIENERRADCIAPFPQLC